MLVIMKNALKERLRSKELYIIVVIGVLLFLLCSSESMTISIEGEALTGFKNMFLILHIAINAIGCVLGVVLSMNTIPKEYERRNSHLVWVRGISQSEYHAGIALANVFSSIIATFILYAMLMVFSLIKGDGLKITNLLVAFFVVAINIAITSLFVSALSVILPASIAGTIGIVFAIAGILHGALDLYGSMAGGIAKTVIKVVLFIVPDLHGIQSQAQNIVMGKSFDWHLFVVGLFALYICMTGIIVFRRKEA